METLQKKAQSVKNILQMCTYPVGVKFLRNEDENPQEVNHLKSHRYCQALMKARHGEKVLLDADGINCPAAAAAFGFKPLPKGLETGKGLVGFGITCEESTGVEMFKGMEKFAPGEIRAVYLFPLEQADRKPDVIVMEEETEKLMWVSLAYLNARGGRRIESSTAILQAACVDATIIPYKQQKMNLSYGCYGCRDATDIKPGEAVLGFPFSDFYPICEYLEHLGKKAIRNSRGKNALAIMQRKEAEVLSRSDPFHS
jgi:uncharacterized protein (DUF169 family)